MRKRKKRWLRRIIFIFLLGVFLLSAVKLLIVYHGYKTSQKKYSEAAAQFTRPAAVAADTLPAETQPSYGENSPAEHNRENGFESDAQPVPKVYAPIMVDFSDLTEVNGDVVGWIYCEDTVINYPVVWGRDNSYYLERDYRGKPDPCGTIFIDAKNAKDLSDSNTILYGHHMQDMTMFATLKYWLEQDYYDAHPVMWLLTPEQDYKIELFSSYVTSADSEAYTIFWEPSSEFDVYLRNVLSLSEVHSEVEIDGEAQYVVLSTCAYSFYLARTVLHGKLVPVDSAGGVPKNVLSGNDPLNTEPIT